MSITKTKLIFNSANKSTKRLASTQRGAAAMVGIVLLVVIVLAALGVGYFALTSKPKTTLSVVPPTVTADSLLTAGKTNNELLIDGQIISKGLDRDEEQRKVAAAALADEAQPVGDGVTSGTVVEAQRLSQIQTEFISEADRRLKALADLSPITAKLTVEQRTIVNKLINDEVTALTGLKAKAAAETANPPFLADRDALDKEYVNYGLAIAQVTMLHWANDQTILNEKVNVLGGKYQERLNDASNTGNSVATAQTLLNSYQTNKTSAKTSTAEALALITAASPNTFNANRAVLQNYYAKLATSHNAAKSALDSAKSLSAEVVKFR